MGRRPQAGFRPLFGDAGFHGLLQLFERANLDLAHPLPRDIIFMRQVFQGRGVILQPAFDKDIAFPLVQGF